MNPDLLRKTWDQAASFGDELPAWFYAALFLDAPETRPMFSAHMAEQRRKLVTMLNLVIRSADRLGEVVPAIQELGRRHVDYGVQPEHYKAVGTALLATLAHFLGDDWTPEVEQTWTEAYQLVADTMIAAAAELEPVDEGGPRG